METYAPTLVAQHPEWQLLLQAYAAEEANAAEQAALERAETKRIAKLAPADDSHLADETVTDPESSSSSDEDRTNEADESSRSPQRKQIWIPRLREVDGIDVDQLAPLHGRLIAEGLLQFNLGGREEGVLYRLTRDARQALNALPDTERTPSEDCEAVDSEPTEEVAQAA